MVVAPYGAAAYLRNVKQLWRGIADRHDDETVVRQRGPCGTDGVFPGHRRCRWKRNAAYLAVQRARGPQAAGLIEEGAHLPGHIAEAGRRAEDNAVIIRQLLRAGDLRLLMLFAPAFKASGVMVSGTRLIVTSTPLTRFAPSATACAVFDMAVH